MNFSVLDGYFDVHSSEDTDNSNHGSYQPPSTASTIIQFNKLSIKDNKEMVILKLESNKIRKQLRHLFKLRATKHETISNNISQSYQRMHLRIAQISKQFGEAQLTIINWRILFEQKYLSEIKSLMTHFDTYTNCTQTHSKPKPFETVSTVPELLEESPYASSGDNLPPLVLPIHDETKDQTDDSPTLHNHEEDEEEEEKAIDIGGVDTIKLQKLNPKKRVQTTRNTHKKQQRRHKYPKTLDISAYLNKFRKKLEMSMKREKKHLQTRCKNLRLALNNEEYLQQRQEALISYEERIAVVLLLFHWLIESNKYELKANVYSRNNIGAQLSGQRVKHYYLCNHVVSQIQRKFDCLILDSRNEIGKQIRIWLKLLSNKDMRHLKPQILLKHINCFIRDFIKSHHYIIADIVRHQQGKYNIEYVIQRHESMHHEEFRQYVTTKEFLCRKNQTKYYYKAPLTAVALRWSLLRLLQRCIYSRLSIIGVLPKLHSLPNMPRNTLVQKTHGKSYDMSLSVNASKAMVPTPHWNSNWLQMNPQCQEDIAVDEYEDTEEKYDTKHARKRAKKQISIAMQMVPLDGRSSMDSNESDIEYPAEEKDEEIEFNHQICSGVSNVEYITFPDKNDTVSVIQYTDASISNQYIQMATFNIYGLPRNSDTEFELLDEHFFNQCGWMRNLSPFQLGIEDIYWCDTPPLNLHANSDLCINVKVSDSMDATPNRWTTPAKDKPVERHGTGSASSSDLSHYGSWRDSQKHGSLPSIADKKTQDTAALAPSNERVTVLLNTDKPKDCLLPPNNAQMYRSLSSKTPRVTMDNHEYNREEDDEFAYDYSVRPFGDALALIECLDELTAPHDMNECLGYVVDVIFRTAQTYRKFNIHKQTKLDRYQLDLSSLKRFKNSEKKESESDEEMNPKKRKKKRRKKKKKKKKKQNSEKLCDSLSNINGEAAIGADVFFPLFIWVIVHSSIRNIHRSVFIMSHYNDSDAMKTKVGYNVSTLHSALDHIMKANKKLYIGKKFRR